MREYEVTVVLKPDLEDEERAKVVERLVAMLTHGEGEEFSPFQDHWGQRALAYPIKKYTDGYYIYFVAKLEPKQINELERNFSYAEEILRYLVIRKED